MLSFLFAHSQFATAQQTIPQTFRYPNLTAKAVSVAGNFNGWNAEVNPLTKRDSLWETTLSLAAGYYQYKFVVDGNWIPDPMNSWHINDGGSSFNSIIKVGEPKQPTREKSSRPFQREKLPKPILEKNPELVELYYAAWEMAWNKIQFGTKASGFALEFMDEGFNEMIYQWDLCFITSFAMYGRSVFPVMQSLDNFYAKQRADGYIQRVYNQFTGEPAAKETTDEPMVNPPLFAWVELRSYNLTGDASRLKRVLPVLVKYYGWLERNCRTEKGKGLYYTSPLGSGMDNTPREGVGKAAWIDMSAQQALAARCIAEIATIVRQHETATEFSLKHAALKLLINRWCWSEQTKFYFDLREDSTLSSTKHVGAYWTFLADVVTKERTKPLLDHLLDPKEFWRPHLVPTLAADDPHYDSAGHYWRGSVWAPTNYMLVQGLMQHDRRDLADSIAFNHLAHVSNIFRWFTPNEDSIVFDERYGDGYKTIWECYSSEFAKPATRWDNTFYSRQDFVGWSGLGPIAMLIENVLGIEVLGSDNKIIWRVKRDDIHGIERLQLRDQFVSLVAFREGGTLKVEADCSKRFTLETVWRNKREIFEAKRGKNVFEISHLR